MYMLGKKKLVHLLSREIGIPLKLKDVHYEKNYFGAPEMVRYGGFSVRTVYRSSMILFTDQSNFCRALCCE